MLTGFDNGSLTPCPLWPVLGPDDNNTARNGWMPLNREHSSLSAIVDTICNPRKPIGIKRGSNANFGPCLNARPRKLANDCGKQNNHNTDCVNLKSHLLSTPSAFSMIRV